MSVSPPVAATNMGAALTTVADALEVCVCEQDNTYFIMTVFILAMLVIFLAYKNFAKKVPLIVKSSYGLRNSPKDFTVEVKEGVAESKSEVSRQGQMISNLYFFHQQ